MCRYTHCITTPTSEFIETLLFSYGQKGSFQTFLNGHYDGNSSSDTQTCSVLGAMFKGSKKLDKDICTVVHPFLQD